MMPLTILFTSAITVLPFSTIVFASLTRCGATMAYSCASATPAEYRAKTLDRLDAIAADLRERLAGGEATNVEKYLHGKVEEKISVLYMAFCLFDCTRTEFRETACVCLSDFEHRNYTALGAAGTLYEVMMTPDGLAEEQEARGYIEEMVFILREALR